MEGLEDPRIGMGPASSGPEFRPASSVPPPPPAPPASPPSVFVGPPRSPIPTVVTTITVALVVLVVVAASLVARYADTHVSAPAEPPVVVPSATERPDRIEFTTSTGSGELILLHRTWVEDGYPIPAYGRYLQVQVEIACTAGTLDYDPDNFQAFDQSGRLFGLSLDNADDADGPPLEIGTLEAGMRVRGGLAFDIPYGAVTLLMSEDNEQSVTALRVPV